MATFDVGKELESPNAGAEFVALPAASVAELNAPGRCVAGGALCKTDLSGVASFRGVSSPPGKLCAFFCFLLVIRELQVDSHTGNSYNTR